jgi:hypothetical protein
MVVQIRPLYEGCPQKGEKGSKDEEKNVVLGNGGASRARHSGRWPEVVAWKEAGRPHTLVLVRGGQDHPDDIAAAYYEACKAK